MYRCGVEPMPDSGNTQLDPCLKTRDLPNLPRLPRFLGQVHEGVARPVAGDSQGTVRIVTSKGASDPAVGSSSGASRLVCGRNEMEHPPHTEAVQAGAPRGAPGHLDQGRAFTGSFGRRVEGPRGLFPGIGLEIDRRAVADLVTEETAAATAHRLGADRQVS